MAPRWPKVWLIEHLSVRPHMAWILSSSKGTHSTLESQEPDPCLGALFSSRWRRIASTAISGALCGSVTAFRKPSF